MAESDQKIKSISYLRVKQCGVHVRRLCDNSSPETSKPPPPSPSFHEKQRQSAAVARERRRPLSEGKEAQVTLATSSDLRDKHRSSDDKEAPMSSALTLVSESPKVLFASCLLLSCNWWSSLALPLANGQNSEASMKVCRNRISNPSLFSLAFFAPLFKTIKERNDDEEGGDRWAQVDK